MFFAYLYLFLFFDKILSEQKFVKTLLDGGKMIDLKQSVQYVKGVGPNNVTLLQKLGINTLEDLITFFPRNYEDR